MHSFTSSRCSCASKARSRLKFRVKVKWRRERAVTVATSSSGTEAVVVVIVVNAVPIVAAPLGDQDTPGLGLPGPVLGTRASGFR